MNIELVRLTNEYKEQLFEIHEFDYYMQNLDTKEETENDWVPDTTLFCLDKDRNIFVGAVNIRHYLNEEFLALDECKKLGINKVLMCCDKENIASAKSCRYKQSQSAI